MGCCNSEKNYPTPPQVSKYPCEIKQTKLCLHVSLQELVDIQEQKDNAEKEKEKEKEENKPGKKKPCENVKSSLKEKFIEKKEKNICAMCFSRKWNAQDTLDRGIKFNELSKWLMQKGKKYNKEWEKCPRELDTYEKSLWIPFCKPRTKPEKCKESIDEGACVFCLENLYTGGFIYELFEKTPLIKKQSDLYGDEIAWRIGMRTRLIVHKKCYDSYVEAFTRNKEKEPVIEMDEKTEEDDELNCGEEEEEQQQQQQQQEVENEEKEEEEKGKISKKKPKVLEEWLCHKNQHFCLKKFEFPKANSGQYIAFVNIFGATWIRQL